jgi:drug/metabolite transporter (DMT)-like permease
MFSSSVILLVVWQLGPLSAKIAKPENRKWESRWFFAAGVVGLQVFGFLWYVIECTR